MERDIPLIPDQIDQAERYSDLGVWNGAMAEAAATGHYADQAEDEDRPRASLRTHEDSSRSTRKKPQEISGREMTRRIDIATPELDPGLRESIRRSAGHAAFLLEKEKLAYEHAVAKANGDPGELRILLRKLAEGKK